MRCIPFVSLRRFLLYSLGGTIGFNDLFTSGFEVIIPLDHLLVLPFIRRCFAALLLSSSCFLLSDSSLRNTSVRVLARVLSFSFISTNQIHSEREKNIYEKYI